MGAGVGAYWFFSRERDPRHRAAAIGLIVLTAACLVVAMAIPFIVHATPELGRPSTDARLRFLSPRPGELIRGNPAIVPVTLHLYGGKIVPFSSLHLVPNEGHIHLYLDGSLVTMTGLDARVTADPGEHSLRAEFVAVDHGPFQPRVLASVTFRVRA